MKTKIKFCLCLSLLEIVGETKSSEDYVNISGETMVLHALGFMVNIIECILKHWKRKVKGIFEGLSLGEVSESLNVYDKSGRMKLKVSVDVNQP